MRAIAIATLGVCVSAGAIASSSRALPVPLGLDLYVPAPADNPISPAKLTLGRKLFFDRRLARDGRTACATCHQPSRAFSDGRALPIGVYGRIGRRNVPSLLNRAYGQRLFWDGRAETIEEQVNLSLSGHTDLDSPAAEAAARIANDRGYVAAFTAAFEEPVSAPGLVRALATYVRGQLSGASAFDRFSAGDHSALSARARLGFDLFTGRANCWRCHAGPLLTDDRFHNTGVSWGRDPGRFELTQRPEDRGRFKTPSLRNVAVTAPYMHDGSVATLEAIVEFYDRGGQTNPNLDPQIRPLRLEPDERLALVAYLRALTGSGYK